MPLLGTAGLESLCVRDVVSYSSSTFDQGRAKNQAEGLNNPGVKGTRERFIGLNSDFDHSLPLHKLEVPEGCSHPGGLQALGPPAILAVDPLNPFNGCGSKGNRRP